MENITRFKKYYSSEKEEMEKLLNKYNSNFSEDENQLIRENLEHFKNLNSSGKMVRGTLVNLGYSLLRNNKNYSYPLALAYEVFQTAILVHDDIIDKDNKRRGKDTVHHANYKKYQKYNSKEVEHLSNSIALCVGDYGLYSANKIIIDNYKDDENLAIVFNSFNDTVLKTIKGELLDVILPFESRNAIIKKRDLEKYIMNIYRLKTAYYTIIGPLTIGLLLAGADTKKIEDIEKFGEKVGIAFQIQDDILGIFSDEMGKVVASDIKEYKQTILYSYAKNTKYAEELEKYYGQEELTTETINKVKDIFIKSKALDKSLKLMNELYDASLDVLNNIQWIDNDKKEILVGFIEYLRERKK